jgi:hypothetical protein
VLCCCCVLNLNLARARAAAAAAVAAPAAPAASKSILSACDYQTQFSCIFDILSLDYVLSPFLLNLNWNSRLERSIFSLKFYKRKAQE